MTKHALILTILATRHRVLHYQLQKNSISYDCRILPVDWRLIVAMIPLKIQVFGRKGAQNTVFWQNILPISDLTLTFGLRLGRLLCRLGCMSLQFGRFQVGMGAGKDAELHPSE